MFFEDVKMAEDGRQVIVATLGDLISAKRITIVPRSLQVLRQMSDDSLQVSLRSAAPPKEQSSSPSLTTPGAGKKFVAKHGFGQKLEQQDIFRGLPRMTNLLERQISAGRILG